MRPAADAPKTEQFDPRAYLCTDITMKPEQMLLYFMRRWQVEVTFQETRQHLGLETQREWNDRAISREAPCILALYSLVTLIASHLVRGKDLPVRQDAWYTKETACFSDALAAVRRAFWRHQSGISYFLTSMPEADIKEQTGTSTAQLCRHLERLTDLLCYAA
jgi:hypothetical protein